MLMTSSFTRTLRFKVRPEVYGWLSAAAVEVNGVFNYCNEASLLAATRTDLKRKWLTGFDLCNLTSGSARFFERIGADTIQRICVEYAQKRSAAKRRRLRWRVSRGARRSLGWVPFKAASLKRNGRAVRFCGKTFRIFEAERLNGVKLGQGCFAQDAVGDWWLCLPVELPVEQRPAPEESVGIDDVSSQKLVKTRMAKAVLDSGWSMLKRFLKYKGEHAGRSVEVVSEHNTTRACSFCGALLGPKGKDMLSVRYWECSECGAEHDRDISAACNILFVGLRKRASVRGNELWHDTIPVEPDLPVRVRYGWGACYATA
jgi:transposase